LTEITAVPGVGALALPPPPEPEDEEPSPLDEPPAEEPPELDPEDGADESDSSLSCCENGSLLANMLKEDS
jgi:hypothetical protein